VAERQAARAVDVRIRPGVDQEPDHVEVDSALYLAPSQLLGLSFAGPQTSSRKKRIWRCPARNKAPTGEAPPALHSPPIDLAVACGAT
jgi:hypothetical protein